MKNIKATKLPQPRTVLLSPRDLAAVVGGTEGTIIVENAVPRPLGSSGGA